MKNSLETNIIKSMKLSNELDNRARIHLPGGVHYNFRTASEQSQIYYKCGKGTRLWDVDGNEYLDFFCKFGANILGHCDERYTNELKNAVEFATAVNHSELEDQVGKMVCDLVPCAEMVRFSLSGTEAVQNALRLARAYTGRNRFIRFIGHFHGTADNVLGGKVSANDPYVIIDNPKIETHGRAKGTLSEQSILLPWNDYDILNRAVDDFEGDIAAILMEPICINGNGTFPQNGYLEKVRKLCDEKGIVLIFDEMITGFRVGLHGAQGMLGVTPDITTLGKAMAGGSLPVSAIAGKRNIMELYENNFVVQGGTFNGYTLGLVAVKAALSILSDNNGFVYENMKEKMSYIHELIESAAADNGMLLKVQGPKTCGSIAVDIKGRRNLLFCAAIKKALLEYGILTSNLVLYSNIHIDDSDIERFEMMVGHIFKRAKEYTQSI